MRTYESLNKLSIIRDEAFYFNGYNLKRTYLTQSSSSWDKGTQNM